MENGDTIIMSDSSGIIILSTEPSWKGLTEEQAFQIKTPENTLKRAYNVTAQWSNLKGRGYASKILKLQYVLTKIYLC